MLALTVAIAMRMANWDYLRALDLAIVWKYRWTIGAGLAETLSFTIAGTLLGAILGTGLGMAGRTSFRLAHWLVVVFVEFWRNTPLLVQLIWIHFALPAFTGIQTSVNQSGLLAMALNVGAYYSEIVRAGVDAVPRGQWEAGYALGLSRYAQWRRIILPQAMRIVIPPTASLAIGAFKGTAILSILSIGELMRVTVRLSDFTYKPIEFFTAAAAIYAIVGIAISRIARRVEHAAKLGQI
jgi:His/Glu/Gln/Arg/opine family amino acid ABC transporter permease subunit